MNERLRTQLYRTGVAHRTAGRTARAHAAFTAARSIPFDDSAWPGVWNEDSFRGDR